MNLDDDLRPLAKRTSGAGIGCRFEVREESISTNLDARAWLESAPESPHGVAFVALRQTAGRGTRGRSWWSPEDAALAMSIVIAPTDRLAHPTAITLLAAVATGDAAAGFGARTRIRWPNDLVDDRGAKLCGILAEIVRLEPPCLIVGIGVNCRRSRFTPPHDLRTPLSDLVSAGAGATSRAEIAIEICRAFDRRLVEFSRDGLGPVIAAFNERSALTGRTVELGHGARTIRGTFDGIDSQFRVIGRDEFGAPFALPCEQVELRGHA